MMAAKPNTLPCDPTEHWHFEFNWDHVGEEDGKMMDTDTITLAASAETWRLAKGHMLEEHEKGPGPRHVENVLF